MKRPQPLGHGSNGSITTRLTADPTGTVSPAWGSWSWMIQLSSRGGSSGMIVPTRRPTASTCRRAVARSRQRKLPTTTGSCDGKGDGDGLTDGLGVTTGVAAGVGVAVGEVVGGVVSGGVGAGVGMGVGMGVGSGVGPPAGVAPPPGPIDGVGAAEGVGAADGVGTGGGFGVAAWGVGGVLVGFGVFAGLDVPGALAPVETP